MEEKFIQENERDLILLYNRIRYIDRTIYEMDKIKRMLFLIETTGFILLKNKNAIDEFELIRKYK